MLAIIIGLFVFVYGLLIGSFLNVCIYRIPLRKTVVRGRSYCPSCSALIPWYLNIPVFSYLLLRGRCKNCHAPISIIYPAVELLNAAFYLLIYIFFGFTAEALALAILFSLLIIIALIMLRYQIIPVKLSGTILALGLLFIALVSLSGATPQF